MPQIKFTVTGEAAAYLRWFAHNILFEKSEDLAARHLLMKQLERMRRQYRKDDPAPEDLTPVPEQTEKKPTD